MTFKRRMVAGRTSSSSVKVSNHPPFENENADSKNLLSSGPPFGSAPAEGCGDTALLPRGGGGASRKWGSKKRLAAYTRYFWFRAVCIAGIIYQRYSYITRIWYTAVLL